MNITYKEVIQALGLAPTRSAVRSFLDTHLKDDKIWQSSSEEEKQKVFDTIFSEIAHNWYANYLDRLNR